MLAEDKAEKEWEASREEREWQAMEDCLDREKVAAVLNDETLVGPLVHLMHDLETGADLARAAMRIRRALVEIMLDE